MGTSEKSNFQSKDGLFSCFPARYVVAIMCFFSIFVEFLMKVCMSVVIVAMAGKETGTLSSGVNITNIVETSSDVCPGSSSTESDSQSEGEFDWDSSLQGHILSAHAYGVIATHVISGRLSELIGAKHVLGLGVLFTSISTMLCPVTARWDVAAFITMRVLFGASSGFILPAVHVLIAKWFPPEERYFMSSLIISSIPLATVVAMSVSGIMAESAGWPLVFYLFGGSGILWFVPWLFLGYSSPDLHPRITEEEKYYIMGKQEEKKVNLPVPWVAILTSLPLWAHIVMSFGYAWIGATLLSQLPTYLTTILHFDLKKSGVVSALPFLLSPFAGMAAGVISQKLRLSGCMSHLNAVRLFNSISAIGSVLFVFAITMVGCDSMTIVVLLCCSMMAVGGYCGGSLINHLDLGSNFAGTTSGISTTMASVAGILTPVITGELTSENKTLTQWSIVFYISMSVTLFGYVFFMIFGSVEEQPWNKPMNKKSESQEP